MHIQNFSQWSDDTYFQLFNDIKNTQIDSISNSLPDFKYNLLLQLYYEKVAKFNNLYSNAIDCKFKDLEKLREMIDTELENLKNELNYN